MGGFIPSPHHRTIICVKGASRTSENAWFGEMRRCVKERMEIQTFFWARQERRRGNPASQSISSSHGGDCPSPPPPSASEPSTPATSRPNTSEVACANHRGEDVFRMSTNSEKRGRFTVAFQGRVGEGGLAGLHFNAEGEYAKTGDNTS